MTRVETERLVLRRWSTDDARPWADILRDPEVRQFLGGRFHRGVFARSAARRDIGGFIEHWDAHGFGPWAVEEKAAGDLVGQVGLIRGAAAVEIGWTLARRVWGRGYATEAGHAALDHAFGELCLDRVVSMTTPANRRSMAVMERLGFERCGVEHRGAIAFELTAARHHALRRDAHMPATPAP